MAVLNLRNLDDDLVRRLKVQAVLRGLPVRELCEELLQVGLEELERVQNVRVRKM